MPASSLPSSSEGKILSLHERENLMGESVEQPSQFSTESSTEASPEWSWGGRGGGRQMAQELELKCFKCHL